MTRTPFTLRLQWVKQIAPQVKHFAFVRTDAKPFSFMPGQFVTLHLPTPDKQVRRSYSLANRLTEEVPLLELAASYVSHGFASDFLFKLQPGDQVEATGPFGRLTLQDEQAKHYWLVATGTGVTPYRTMLGELARRMAVNPALLVTLLFGVRTPADALYREEFVEFAAQHPRFQFRLHYSQSETPFALPYEYQGYVSTAFQALKPCPQTDIIYLCGNPNMVDAVFTLLTAQGFTSNAIRREKYISSK